MPADRTQQKVVCRYLLAIDMCMIGLPTHRSFHPGASIEEFHFVVFCGHKAVAGAIPLRARCRQFRG
eukprot:11195992-Lingulodinium_polyedra.AAC.1